MRGALRRPVLLLVVLCAVGGCAVSVAGVPAPDRAALVAIPTATPTPTLPPGDPSDHRYTDAKGRFRIAAPPGWAPDTSGAQGTAVIFRDPTPAPVEGGMFSVSINVLVVSSSADLPATVDGSRRDLRARSGYTVTADEDATLSDGTPAHLFGGGFTAAGTGYRLRNLQLLTVAGGSTIVVTGTAPAASWESHADVLDAALRTLTVAG